MTQETQQSHKAPKKNTAGVFLNRNGQLRSGWKVAILWIVFAAATGIVGTLLSLALYAAMGAQFLSNPLLGGGMDVLQVLFEIGAVVFMVYVIERKRLSDFGLPGLRRHRRDFGTGILLGACSLIVVFLVLRVTGNVTLAHGLAHPVFTPNLLYTLVLFTMVGFGEEMMSRGYSLTVIARQTGKLWLGVLLSALIFASMHLMNPHVAPLAFVNLMLFGILTAAMYIKSGSLWMPIGFHAAWDYFEGNVFGFPDSGMTMTSIYPFHTIRDNILTGGGFGPEGGLLVTCILTILLVFMTKVYKRQAASTVFKQAV